MPIYDQTLPTNFSPLVTDKVIVDSNYYVGGLSITELAESIKPQLETSAVKALFPEIFSTFVEYFIFSTGLANSLLKAPTPFAGTPGKRLKKERKIS